MSLANGTGAPTGNPTINNGLAGPVQPNPYAASTPYTPDQAGYSGQGSLINRSPAAYAAYYASQPGFATGPNGFNYNGVQGSYNGGPRGPGDQGGTLWNPANTLAPGTDPFAGMPFQEANSSSPVGNYVPIGTPGSGNVRLTGPGQQARYGTAPQPTNPVTNPTGTQQPITTAPPNTTTQPVTNPYAGTPSNLNFAGTPNYSYSGGTNPLAPNNSSNYLQPYSYLNNQNNTNPYQGAPSQASYSGTAQY